MQTATRTELTVLALRATLDGQLVLPGDAEWDEARRAWNLAVDQQPDAVVYPAGADDVVAVVEFARETGRRIAVQGTGHGAAPRGGSLEGTILVNMGRLDGFEIDAETRTVRVQPGALWGPVADAAGELGLAGLAGSARDVGIVGYSLGGGIGWLGRRYGIAANSVRAIELVTGDGEQLRVDADNHPDLFWALRGGGGSFGVVTAMELELFPVEQVYAGWLLWPVEQARAVLELYAGWVDDIPDELTSVVRILHLPPIEAIPEPLRGKSWAVVEAAYLGDEAQAGGLLAPLRAGGPAIDTFAAMPASALGHLHADPPEPAPGIGDGFLLDGLTPGVIEDVVRVAGAGSGTSIISLEIRHLDGALGRPHPDGGVLDRLDGKYAAFAIGVPMGPDHAQRVETDLRAVLGALAPCSSGRFYLNFMERPGDAGAAFAPATYRRLAGIRAAYDPERLFRPNHPVELAS